MPRRCRLPVLAFSISMLSVCVACDEQGGSRRADGSTDAQDLGFIDGGPVNDALPDDADGQSPDAVQPGDVTVEPARIDDVLVNPGMGFASFHFGWWCDLPPISFSPQECADRVLQHWPTNYPPSGTAYFRWHWRDLEPQRGQIAFDLIDAAIQSANLLGMTLGFRVMTIAEGESGVPNWLTAPPYSISGQWLAGAGGDTFWPDVRDATLQSEHARFISALGARYDDHPAVDHIDIGTVGCYGEWNTACLTDGGSIIEAYAPADAAERQQIVTALTQLIDHHLAAFPTTPVLMLGQGGASEPEELGLMLHATQGGAGWRVDCWGDWGIWGGAWSHQETLYPDMLAAAASVDPAFPDLWKQAPVHLEVCGTLPQWHDLGWTAAAPDGEVHKSFQWALEQHASLLNVKSTEVPADYLTAIDELLVKNGYRLVIDRFNHHGTVAAGTATTFVSQWSNLGVAPAYLARTLTYRLRGPDTTVSFASAQDIRTWLPGSWTVTDTVTLPSDLPAGTYQIDVALVDRDGTAPDTTALAPLHLGIAGRGDDGWYTLSQLTVE